jgi:hypothetical protein
VLWLEVPPCIVGCFSSCWKSSDAGLRCGRRSTGGLSPPLCPNRDRLMVRQGSRRVDRSVCSIIQSHLKYYVPCATCCSKQIVSWVAYIYILRYDLHRHPTRAKFYIQTGNQKRSTEPGHPHTLKHSFRGHNSHF